MPKRGENIYKRKDGRWEGRYIKSSSEGVTKWGYVYAKTYKEVKKKLQTAYQNQSESSQKPLDVTIKLLKESFGSVASEWLFFTQPQIKRASYTTS